MQRSLRRPLIRPLLHPSVPQPPLPLFPPRLASQSTSPTRYHSNLAQPQRVSIGVVLPCPPCDVTRRRGARVLCDLATATASVASGRTHNAHAQRWVLSAVVYPPRSRPGRVQAYRAYAVGCPSQSSALDHQRSSVQARRASLSEPRRFCPLALAAKHATGLPTSLRAWPILRGRLLSRQCILRDRCVPRTPGPSSYHPGSPKIDRLSNCCAALRPTEGALACVIRQRPLVYWLPQLADTSMTGACSVATLTSRDVAMTFTDWPEWVSQMEPHATVWNSLSKTGSRCCMCEAFYWQAVCSPELRRGGGAHPGYMVYVRQSPRALWPRALAALRIFVPTTPQLAQNV
ncbi:uncharacterized protein C8Q71DRAFT_325137 [Rhodofomes roseus]|uniref:Uncharacterized protein n=1 Tax=Rhodofomes roseus TaxID=34475 RepID=A0ABQ8K2C3_9APHY|nr:uncharacterized protein C8Q71DRAFT_325137 [Rhodofomes roseus]KAH9830853.1 hypothetical protein C8Q71DRAFT_325137 [Rhodofomes roseus]